MDRKYFISYVTKKNNEIGYGNAGITLISDKEMYCYERIEEAQEKIKKQYGYDIVIILNIIPLVC